MGDSKDFLAHDGRVKDDGKRLPRVNCRRHSTPKKENVEVDFDSTQYIPLNINSRTCHLDKVCNKCLLFKVMPPSCENVDNVIDRLEEIKQCLDRNNDCLSETRRAMQELHKSNYHLRKGLDDHLEWIKGVLLHLDDVTSHFTSLMAKEDLFLAHLATNNV